MKNKKPSSPNINVVQYFAATLLPAIIILGLGLSYMKTLNTDISYSKSELAILPSLQRLYQDILNLQKIRGLQYLASTTNDSSLQPEIDSLQQALNHLHESTYTLYPGIEKKHSEIHAKTKLTYANARLAEANPDETFNSYSSLVFDHFLLLRNIAKESNLLLDLDLDIFTLVEISVMRIPAITEIIGQLRGRNSAWLYDRKIEEHQTQIEYMFESGRRELKLLQASITSLSRYKEIEGILNTAAIGDALADYFVQFHSILNLSPSKQQSKILFMKGSQVLDSIRLLNKQVINILKLRLDKRIQKQRNKQIVAMLSMALAILSMAYFIFRFHQSNRDSFAAEVRAREDLAKAETRQRTIVDTMIDGLITIDQNGIIQSFNPAAEILFGHKARDIIGKNVNILLPEPHQSRHNQYLKKYLETGEENIIGIGREVTGLHKNGSTFPIELSVTEMKLGKERLFSGIVRDISERMHVDKLKDEFISSVSHELRTPLTSIRGALGLINGGVVGELPEEAMAMFRIACNNTDHLLLLINDILDIQKITSGEMAFNFNVLEIMPFLQNVIQDNAVYGAQYGVHFVISKPIPGARVYADKVRLQQVMTNLLSNAAKFSATGTTVELSVSHSHNAFRISVADHGCGISDDFKPRLFERFSQSDFSDTRQKSGTGLGLSISKVIIEKHGGLIDFTSEKGIGSTFYIELPEFRDKL